MKKILNTITRAYGSLKVLCDPAIEGNPYEIDTVGKSYRANRSNQPTQFLRRRFGWK